MEGIKKRMILVFMIVIAAVLLVVITNVLIIMLNGTAVPAPIIDRGEKTIGAGDTLQYLVLGDSTTVAQGGDYAEGYVVKSAEKLAQKYKVTYLNQGVSGATINDVLDKQLPLVREDFKPDLVLVAAGANDVTHLTRLSSIRGDLSAIIDKIREMNPDAVIIFTGSASMGDVKRFPQPTKWLAGLRTKQINDVFLEVVKEKDVTFAYVAAKTSESFSNNPQYFAVDNFHPNNEGYKEWTNVINEAIETALQTR